MRARLYKTKTWTPHGRRNQYLLMCERADVPVWMCAQAVCKVMYGVWFHGSPVYAAHSLSHYAQIWKLESVSSSFANLWSGVVRLFRQFLDICRQYLVSGIVCCSSILVVKSVGAQTNRSSLAGQGACALRAAIFGSLGAELLLAVSLLYLP